ncbi:MAG TPA: diacylglycerol kinase family protein [Candidatus Paceibacterota bacterium]|nr:diacylglycerol kinase family protein [Candidatus Paceibacterota bacterium]
MTNLFKSFGWAIHGLKTVWKEERNFRIDVAVGALVLILAFFRNFAPGQWVFLVLIIALVLMGEIVNTAVEDICNKIQPEQDPIIGKIKDIMAGYVLISALAAVVAGIMLFVL